MRGLGLIFREQDYQTVFIHAAPDNSMGIAAICRIAGYERFLSQSDFPSGNYNGSWGVWDHVALERLTTEMDAAAEPFHYGIFSLCTHSPWSLPEGFRPRFESDHSDAEILNTFAYLDDALRAFFEREAARERFSRTVYVIVGDHTTHADEVERFHVGALFYAPGRIEPAVHHQISTQLDILPTIIDLTGIETAHSSFGSSLFSEQPAADWSAHFQSNMLQFREGDRMLVSDIRHTIALVDPSDPKLTGGGLMSSEPGITEELTFKLKSLFQTSEMLMQTNRIAPLIARSNVLSE
jgi:phosphoglycerol transferase MdoB-like AlkP superfamily enzyme